MIKGLLRRLRLALSRIENSESALALMNEVEDTLLKLDETNIELVAKLENDVKVASAAQKTAEAFVAVAEEKLGAIEKEAHKSRIDSAFTAVQDRFTDAKDARISLLRTAFEAGIDDDTDMGDYSAAFLKQYASVLPEAQNNKGPVVTKSVITKDKDTESETLASSILSNVFGQPPDTKEK